jgi:hypothetical protein
LPNTAEKSAPLTKLLDELGMTAIMAKRRLRALFNSGHRAAGTLAIPTPRADALPETSVGHSWPWLR